MGHEIGRVTTPAAVGVRPAQGSAHRTAAPRTTRDIQCGAAPSWRRLLGPGMGRPAIDPASGALRAPFSAHRPDKLSERPSDGDSVENVISHPAPPTESEIKKARKGRRLTEGEAAIAREIFGNSLDLSKVRLYSRKYIFFQPENTVMAPNGNVYFPPKVYENDFSAPGHRLALRRLFIHELVHVWQYQSGVDVRGRAIALHIRRFFGGPDPYEFELSPNRLLRDYNVEAQANVIREYFSPRSEHPSDVVEGLENALSEFLEDPTYLRRQVAAERRAREERDFNHPSGG